ncbi:MAG TPA: hypothetical protein DCX06_01765 [Opitutae bacterium]|nr:hypothetical protein [Opitutae bacterium]
MSAVKKTSDDPSVFAAYFYGLLVAMFGALLGAYYMASFPALAFNQNLEIEKFNEGKAGRLAAPGDLYYMEGPLLRTRAWEAKRQALIGGQPGVVDLNHAELNAWLAAKFRPAEAPEEGEAPSVLVIPGVPNVYFAEEIVYISLPTEIIVFGKSHEHTIVAIGRIENQDTTAAFNILNLRIDNAVMPLVNQLGPHLIGTLLKAYAGSDEFISIQEAWSRVESVEQSEGTLRLKLR